MKIDIDASELTTLGKVLADAAPGQAAGAVHRVTIAESAAVLARAKAAAPKDRPWLATQGIRRKSGKDAAGSWSIVYTIPDPEDRRVAFYVEYGTAVMPPQPFMTPAVAPAEQSYPAAILAQVDPFDQSSSGGLEAEDA